MSPHVLFVPVSGGSGFGELARCRVIAGGLIQAIPAATAAIFTPERFASDDTSDVRRHLIDASPTHRTTVVNRVIRDTRPDIVVFDSSCRVSQLSMARRCGARVVYIASRPSRRRRGFALRRLRRIDQMWLLDPAHARTPLRVSERLLVALAGRPEVLFLDPVFPSLTRDRAAAVRSELGVPASGYPLWVPGGGGWTIRGRSAVDVFVEGATRLSDEAGIAGVVVAGPLHDGGKPPTNGLTWLDAVDVETMAALVDGAGVVITGGGSMISQVLAQGRPCVAAPLGGRDQAARVATAGEHGWILASTPEPEDLASHASSVLDGSGVREGLLTRIRGLGLGNGLDPAVEALRRLAGDSGD